MHQEMSRHHKKCRANGGKTSIRNVILIQDNLHRAWHTLFGSMSGVEIARVITNVFLDPDYQMICQQKKNCPRDKQLKLNL